RTRSSATGSGSHPHFARGRPSRRSCAESCSRAKKKLGSIRAPQLLRVSVLSAGLTFSLRLALFLVALIAALSVLAISLVALLPVLLFALIAALAVLLFALITALAVLLFALVALLSVLFVALVALLSVFLGVLFRDR